MSEHVFVKIPQSLQELSRIYDNESRDRAMGAVVLHIRSAVEEYPKSGPGNLPPAPYYVRGTGMIGKDGRVIEGQESQKMSAKWSYRVSPSQGIIKNDTDYAPYVIGRQQRRYHARRGWINVPYYVSKRSNIQEFGNVYYRALVQGNKLVD